MSKKNKKELEKTGNEIFESPEALEHTVEESTEFLQKNKTAFAALTAFVAILLAAYFGYSYYMDEQNNLAQEELFSAVFYFENEKYDLALDGDGNHAGFLDIISDYGSTQAGNLAKYYAGAIYMKQGKYDEAIAKMKDFSAGDYLLQSRSYAVIGDALLEKGQPTEAASYYEKAANNNANKNFSPVYLKKAALAYEASGNLKGAISAYKEIVEEYRGSSEYMEARKQLARLNALASK
ncbi:MAG: tetratricopeptide repeat protein [Cytophagales bacterium]|nr:tetratricopeptide repeat protein [Cytophagales bacterium]